MTKHQERNQVHAETVAEAARRLGVSRQRIYHIRRRAAGVCIRCGGELVTKNFCEKHRESKHRPLSEARKEKKRQYMRARNRTPDGLARREVRKLSKYGLTRSDYDRILAEQGGACAICGDRPRVLHVDHSHLTGAVRGLLCTRCNPGIGYFRESTDLLRRAIVYLGRQ